VDSDIELLRRVTRPRWDLVRSGRVTPAKYNPMNISSFIDIDVDRAVEAILGVIGGARQRLPSRILTSPGYAPQPPSEPLRPWGVDGS